MQSVSGCTRLQLPQRCKLYLSSAKLRNKLHNTASLSVAYYYDVMLHTGNRFGAGTDANVYLKLYGQNGSSDEIKLPARQGDLERGMVNKYKITAPHLGNLKKIDIRHDNHGLAPAWFLDKVTIKDHSGSRFIFDYGEWLLKRAGENKLQAELSLSEQNLDQLPSYQSVDTNYGKALEKEHLEAVEKTVHQNLTGVLEGIIQSDFTSSFGDYEPSDTGSKESNAESPKQSEVLMLPSARLLVEGFALALGKIPSTGPKGHLLKGDVLGYIEQHSLTRPKLKPVMPPVQDALKTEQFIQAPKSSNVIKKAKQAEEKSISRKTTTAKQFEDVIITEEKRRLASQYIQSKTEIPHLYSSVEMKLDNLLEVRNDLGQQGASIPIDAFLLKGIALALSKVPEINVLVNNGVANTLTNTDIAINMTTNKGTTTPVVKNVHQMRLQDVADALQDFEKAESSVPEFKQTASLTICNLGTNGISYFSEIITPPQVGFIAVGAPKMVLSNENTMSKSIVVTLSCDGRIIDELVLSKFLSIIKSYVEDPLTSS